MSTFLYIQAGSVPVLLNGDAVLEIIDLDVDKQKQNLTANHFSWRDKMLKVASGRQLLERPDTDDGTQDKQRVGVIYQLTEDCLPLMLLVDSVKGIIQLEDNVFTHLPPVPQKTADFFDGIYTDPESKMQVLRMCYPLNQILTEQILAA